jgi:hypothetical protein
MHLSTQAQLRTRSVRARRTTQPCSLINWASLSLPIPRSRIITAINITLNFLSWIISLYKMIKVKPIKGQAPYYTPSNSNSYSNTNRSLTHHSFSRLIWTLLAHRIAKNKQLWVKLMFLRFKSVMWKHFCHSSNDYRARIKARVRTNPRTKARGCHCAMAQPCQIHRLTPCQAPHKAMAFTDIITPIVSKDPK